MTYIQIHKGKGLTLLAIGIVILCVVVLAHVHRVSGSTVFGSCAQARKAGYSNIPKSSHFYNPALDKDHDNVACE